MTSILGLALLILSLITASFAKRVVHLILTQGLLYGLGGALLYSPFIFYLDEWFDRRKGLAFGVLWARTAVGGIVVPLILEWGLERYEFRIILRAWAVLLVSISCLFLVLHTDKAEYGLPGCISIALDLRRQTTFSDCCHQFYPATGPGIPPDHGILGFPMWKYHSGSGFFHAIHISTK